MSRWLGAGVLVAACLAAPAGAQAPAGESRAAVEQRIALTSRLLGDSQTAQRIATSGSVEARAHIDDGRIHHALAEEAMQRGDLAEARKHADEALRHIASARRLAPDAPTRQSAARQRHEQLLGSLERMLEAWRQRLPAGSTDDGDRSAAMGLIDTARYLAQSGRYEESVHVLATAERHVLAGMSRLLASRELDYTQRPGSPAEEFQLELLRNQSLMDLIPVALADLRPPPDAQAQIARLSEASRALRLQAIQRFERGEVTQALTHIRNSSSYLQRALGAAGVALPAPTGETS